MTAAGPTTAGSPAAIVGGVMTINPRRALVQTMRGTHLLVLDAVAALVITGASAGIALNPGSTVRFTGPAWAAVLVSMAVGLPIAVRRRWPLAVLGVVTGTAVVSTVYGISPAPIVPVALALYLVGTRVPGRRSLLAAGLCLVALAVGVIGSGIADPPDDPANIPGAIALVWLITGGTWACGRALHTRRAHEKQIADERARQALTEERMRIARDVHDVVAHGMSLIAARAGIANHVAESHPEQAREALRLIEDTSRSALRDMRRVLGVLRADAELAPAGLGGLADLAGQARRAGVEVELSVPDGNCVPDGPAQVAYRIVQESLTNVIKHAGPARCRVVVEADDETLTVTVTDDGRGPGFDPGDGHGLVGMRERVAMYGGTFRAGPRDGGGFEVAARVPYGPGPEERP